MSVKNMKNSDSMIKLSTNIWFTSNADWVCLAQTANCKWRIALHPQCSCTALLQASQGTQSPPASKLPTGTSTHHQHHRHFLLPRSHLLPTGQLLHRLHHSHRPQQHLTIALPLSPGSSSPHFKQISLENHWWIHRCQRIDEGWEEWSCPGQHISSYSYVSFRTWSVLYLPTICYSAKTAPNCSEAEYKYPHSGYEKPYHSFGKWE